MEIVIRPIEEKDYPEITALFAGEILGNPQVCDEYRNHVTRFFNQVKNNDQYITFVALHNDAVAGFISAAAMQWIASGCLFIQCIAVKKEYQNRGVGTKLLESIEDYAQAKGLTGTGLQSGVQRAAAHAFYERKGYTKSHYFYKNFKPERRD